MNAIKSCDLVKRLHFTWLTIFKFALDEDDYAAKLPIKSFT